jgi:hypothetical protein
VGLATVGYTKVVELGACTQYARTPNRIVTFGFFDIYARERAIQPVELAQMEAVGFIDWLGRTFQIQELSLPQHLENAEAACGCP